MAKSKAKSGTWFPREMSRSRAYWALSGTAKGILLQFLMKRNMNNQHHCTNINELTMTYKELENIFGKKPDGKPDGVSRGAITKGLNDLLAKGFISIIKQGGAFQKDKTIYGLTDDWKQWRKGDVLRTKPRGRNAGRPTHKDNFGNFLNPTGENHTHPTGENLNSNLDPTGENLSEKEC